MAIVGMMIGLSFSIAIVLGPLIQHYFALTGIFWATAAMGALALILLFTTIAKPPRLISQQRSLQGYRDICKHPQLLRLNGGIFTQHAMLTSLFVVLPLIFSNQLHLSGHQQTITYLTVLALAFIASIPLIIIAEKKRKMKAVFITAIATLSGCSLLLAILPHSRSDITILLLLFFCAFSLLEACLPSLVSKIASIHNKGTAMGIYSTAQFLGIFVGGSVAGWLYGHYGIPPVLLFMTALGICWLLYATTMAQPPYWSTVIYPAPANQHNAQQLVNTLEPQAGIKEVALAPAEQLIYLKVDKKIININELRKQIEACNLA